MRQELDDSVTSRLSKMSRRTSTMSMCWTSASSGNVALSTKTIFTVDKLAYSGFYYRLIVSLKNWKSLPIMVTDEKVRNSAYI